MVPPLKHPIWTELVTGNLPVHCSKVAVNMLVANVRLSYRLDRSDTNLHQLATNVHEFFEKYDHLYQSELKDILTRAAYA